MITRISKLIRGKRNDALVFCIALFCAVSLLLPWGLQFELMSHELWRGPSLFLLAGLIGFVFASSVVAASSSFPTTSRIGVSLGIALMALGLWSSLRLHGIWQLDKNNLYFGYVRGDVSWLAPKGVLALVGSFVICTMVFWIVQGIANKSISKLKSIRVTRKSLLIGLAGILFVVTMANNFYQQYNERTGWSVFGNEMDPRPVVPVFAILFFCVPGVLASRITSFPKRIGTVLFVVGLFVLAGIGLISTTRFDHPNALSWAVGVLGFCFALPLILLAHRRDKLTPDVDRSDASKENLPGERGLGISWLYSAPIIVLLTSAFVFLQLYDLSTLLLGGNNKWAVARQYRILNLDPATQVLYRGLDPLGSAELIVRFSENSRRDTLEKFSSLTIPTAYGFINLREDIDCKPIGLVLKNSVLISNSSVTAEQMRNITSNCGHLNIHENVQFSGESLYSPVVSHCSISKLLLGEIADFLSPIEDFSAVGGIFITGQRISVEDWEEIVRAAQQCPINFYGTLPDDLFERWSQKPDQSLANIVVTLSANNTRAIKLAFDTDANVSLRVDPTNSTGPPISSNASYWDLLMALGQDGGLVGQQYSNLGLDRIPKLDLPQSLREHAIKNHWLYNSNDETEGEVVFESFFFPGAIQRQIDHLPSLANLKSLSLDQSWVNSQINPFGNTEHIDLKALGKLTQLEELCLPAGAEPIDLTFLAKLPKLKELRISPIRREIRLAGFEQCTALTKLTLMNTPDIQVLKEVAKIKTLEELKIIDYGFGFYQPDRQEALRKKFPNVNVIIVNSQLYRTDLPEEFKSHLKRIRTRLRSELIKD